MDKKYELFKESGNNELYRIRAVRDFGDVKAGDVGGFVEGKHNLSHDGNCWISGNARVYGNALVYGNARIFGNALVYGDACISGNASVFGGARVFGNAWIYDNARVFGNARVHGNARVSDYAWISGNARVHGKAWICGNALVFGDAAVYGNAWVFGNACIYGNTQIYGDAQISGNARVHGKAWICGNALVFGDAAVYGNAWVCDAAVACERNHVSTGILTTDITNGRNKLDAIRCGMEDVTINDDGTEVICYKKVCDDLSSLHDSKFKYEVGKWVEEPNYDPDPAVSCGKGLHFAGPKYWNRGTVLLECCVKVEDVIAVQEGKIRAKRAFVVKSIE